MEFTHHRQDMPAGQVVYNAYQQAEDISLVMGCNKIKFERTESESSSESSYGEEDDNTVCALST